MLCSMLTAASIFVGACSGATSQVMSDTPPSFDPVIARDMINMHRQRYGLPPVAIDERLMKAAQAHSGDMSRRGRISHKGSDGSLPKDRARAFGYAPKIASENVAAGYNNTADVITDWQRSRGHNANLLRRGAKHMGMALVYNPQKGKQTYWTLLMGVPR